MSSRNGAEGIKWNLNDLYKGINDKKIERDITLKRDTGIK